MSVGFAKPRNPEHIPEHHLWTLRKDGKTAEARVRQVQLGPELRIYYNGAFLRSEVVRDGATWAPQLRKRKRLAWRAGGWTR